jgi:hypothetical protein
MYGLRGLWQTKEGLRTCLGWEGERRNRICHERDGEDRPHSGPRMRIHCVTSGVSCGVGMDSDTQDGGREHQRDREATIMCWRDKGKGHLYTSAHPEHAHLADQRRGTRAENRLDRVTLASSSIALRASTQHHQAKTSALAG